MLDFQTLKQKFSSPILPYKSVFPLLSEISSSKQLSVGGFRVLRPVLRPKAASYACMNQ